MSRSRTRRTAATVRTAADQVVATSRLVLAAKTAITAAIAWYLAPLVPFADADYSYYAPLGVLVSMFPTVLESMRTGVLALSGLAAGIGLGVCGLVLVGVGTPGVVAVALVVGIGTALGGIRAWGAGADWIAIAGLFVLLLGGGGADEFSMSYLVTMGFGVVIGLAANYVFPPIYLQSAEQRLDELRERLADALRRMGDMVEESDMQREELDRMEKQLEVLVGQVASDVREGDRSRRANPRARRLRRVQQRNDDRLWALQWSTFLVRDLTDLLGRHRGLSDDDDRRTDLLVAALRRTADAVAAPWDAPEASALTDDAMAAADRYLDAVGTGGPPFTDRRLELTTACTIGSVADATRVAAP